MLYWYLNNVLSFAFYSICCNDKKNKIFVQKGKLRVKVRFIDDRKRKYIQQNLVFHKSNQPCSEAIIFYRTEKHFKKQQYLNKRKISWFY
jgi:hypothetical protein